MSYHKNLDSVRGYYADQCVLADIDGNPKGGMDKVSSDVLTEILQRRLPSQQ